MKVLQRRTTALMLAAVASMVVAGAAEAQRIPGSVQSGAPTRDTQRLMVAIFRSQNPELAVGAADAVRERLQRDINARQLFIVTKGDVENTLEASGYPKDEALSPNDAQALARIVRADQYVEGAVTPSPEGGLTVTARMVLTRDHRLVQPLGSFNVGRVGDAASQISREVRNARRQLEAEQRCVNNYRDANYEQAAAEARKARDDYPNATIARVCEVRAMVAMDAPPEQILSLTDEILEIHPQNQPALTLAYEAYKEQGDQDRALEALTTLLSVDPGNATLQQAVVTELAASRRFDTAVPIIDRALAENPMDPDLLNTAFQVYLASENYQKAAAAGEALIPLDTAVTDTTFYMRLARAYASDSQPQQAAEAAARGTRRYPDNVTLWTVAAQFYRRAGQIDQATVALDRAQELDPNASSASLMYAQIYADRNEVDSAVVALRRAGSADSAGAAELALGFGNQKIQAAQADSTLRTEWKEAEAYLGVSDELTGTDQAKFLRGYAAFQFVAKSYSAVQQSGSCEAAEELREYTQIASTSIRGGGRFNPDAAAQLLGVLPGIQQTMGQLVQHVCN